MKDGLQKEDQEALVPPKHNTDCDNAEWPQVLIHPPPPHFQRDTGWPEIQCLGMN